MWQTFLAGLVIAVVSAILAALFTHFVEAKSFTDKMNEKVAELADIKSFSDKMFQISETVTDRHAKEMHQTDTIKFVEKEIISHEENCGKTLVKTFSDIKSEFNGLKNNLQHMEIRQAKANMKINLVSYMLGEIAKKMNIAVDINRLTNGDDDE